LCPPQNLSAEAWLEKEKQINRIFLLMFGGHEEKTIGRRHGPSRSGQNSLAEAAP
jgi:hypothetical protein